MELSGEFATQTSVTVFVDNHAAVHCGLAMVLQESSTLTLRWQSPLNLYSSFNGPPRDIDAIPRHLEEGAQTRVESYNETVAAFDNDQLTVSTDRGPH